MAVEIHALGLQIYLIFDWGDISGVKKLQRFINEFNFMSSEIGFGAAVDK